MLWSIRIKETIASYKEILRCKCLAYDVAWGRAALHRDQVAIMVASPNQHHPFENPNFTGSRYFDRIDVDALCKELKNQVIIVYPIEDFNHGMREFAIPDNNGYILQFGQDLSEIKNRN